MKKQLLGVSLALGLMAFMWPATGAAATSSSSSKAKASLLGSDIREPGAYLNNGKQLPIRKGAEAIKAAKATAAAGPSKVGDERVWLALDDFRQVIYLKTYTLRAVGDKIEVWVANDQDHFSSDLRFQQGDCRNGKRTIVTDQQARYLADQFDNNMYPKESAVFSVPPDRNGVNAPLASILGLPNNYYKGQGDRVVTLVDNVRDDNFYDLNNTNNFSYIAGFFTSTFNFLLNRNVMTIDGFDWLHRTTASPPNEPVPGDNCKSAPARPFLYEGVFAHEYQHLLESYEDPGETTWANEGLSDYAIFLTGYGDPSTPITQIGFDSHIQCFQGYLGVLTDANPNPRNGGPENSLTLWGDQTDFESEILCDYGAAYSFMLYLADHFGEGFITDLHRDDRHGLDSLDALLKEHGATVDAVQVMARWAAMMALDSVLDDGATLLGDDAGKYTTAALDASINWNTDQTYSSPGAPPNGSDYVRVRRTSGNYLSAGEINSITFDGAEQLAPLPMEWTVDADPPTHEGNPALYSGTGDNEDRAIVREVSVPTGSPSLTFDTAYDLESDFDYGYVQISTDGGETYTSIQCTDSVDAPLGPGFNGNSGGGINGDPVAFKSETCDLSAFAGQTVVLAFHLVTDASVHFDGWWVDNVAIGGTLISDGSTLDGWQTPTQFNPVEVEGFKVQLVAYTNDHQAAWIGEIPLDANWDGSLSGAALDEVIGTTAQTVAAIVSYRDKTETVTQYAPYTLRVNGHTQPGG